MSNHVQNDQGKRLKKILVLVILALHPALGKLYIKNGERVGIHSNDPKMIPTMIYQCGEFGKKNRSNSRIPSVKGFNKGN